MFLHIKRIDAQLAQIAAGQHGLITLQQALLHGLGRHQVKHRVRSGRWVRAQRGVYRIAGAAEDWQQRALAACLAAPDGAVASHLTAAALTGLDLAAPPIPHLSVGRGRSTRLSDAYIHRTRLTVADVTTLQRVPATVPARTLIDCAAVLGPNRLQRLVEEALHRRLVTVAQVPREWDRTRLRPGRAGEVRLRSVLEAWDGRIAPGSPAEARLRRQVVQWGYPEPGLQIRIRDGDVVLGRIDLGWENVRIGIEYDSDRWHQPTRWENDEARHRAIEVQGWLLLHADKLDLRPGQGALRDALARAWRTRAGTRA
ncbi:DUF559 domain-containing protein [soil metagenome]